MSNIRFSIIMASFNYEAFITQAIESVLAQTYPHWELIIVDDGSNDNSLEIIKSFESKDKRINAYTHDNCKNKGLKETILLGLEKAKEPWVAFLESDDFWDPDFLAQKASVVFKHPSVEFIFNSVKTFGESSIVKFLEETCIAPCEKLLANGSFPRKIPHYFLKRNVVFSFSCVCIKKTLLHTCNFNSPIEKYIDYYLWSQIAPMATTYYTEQRLTHWRMHSTSYIQRTASANSDQQVSLFSKSILRNLSRCEKRPFLFSILILLYKSNFIRKNTRTIERILMRAIDTLPADNSGKPLDNNF